MLHVTYVFALIMYMDYVWGKWQTEIYMYNKIDENRLYVNLFSFDMHILVYKLYFPNSLILL